MSEETKSKVEFTLRTPKSVYDDPVLWLNIPHSLHSSLSDLMGKMFDCDWKKILADKEVHCIMCENGLPPLPILAKQDDGTMKERLLTGYIGKPGAPGTMLMTKEVDYLDGEQEIDGINEKVGDTHVKMPKV